MCLADELAIRAYADADFDTVVARWHETNLASHPYNEAQQRHTLADARRFFRNHVLTQCEVIVANQSGRLLGMLALQAPWIRQFAIFPEHQRKGIGTALLQRARDMSATELRLFTFQRNTPARAFYDKHGFHVVALGISPAPECEPDVEYRWTPILRSDSHPGKMPDQSPPKIHPASQEPAMSDTFLTHVRATLDQIRADGFYKTERVIESPQSPHIGIAGGREVLNFCANNYLGLADDPRLVRAAKAGLDRWGFGMASVRFICGTQSVHKQLEGAIATFLRSDDAILYGSCFDANGGLFETLLGEEDAIISDELNHASIVDGIRLCKAKRFRYRNNDMADLAAKLAEADAAGARYKMIATDGVFSMDGIIADLRSICDLAERHRALVMVDDSHAVGFVGEGGRGTPEHCGVEGRVDIITGTLGKALGGASGGYTAGRREIVELLRQRSRPYLFSNTLAPCIAAASLDVLALLQSDEGAQLRRKVRANGDRFRSGMSVLGFDLVPGQHPIIPVMLGDAELATRMADALLEEGIYVIGFSFPVVPRGKARIRTQMSAAHTAEQIDQAVAAFAKIGRRLQAIR